MAAAILKRFGVKAQLIKGGGGIFDVKLDGTKSIFSKDAVGRFPTDEEVLDTLAEHSSVG